MEQIYIIGNATTGELLNYYNIQHGLGWDPMHKCQLLAEATDMDGCFFGKLDGKIVSSITAMKYGKYGFIGVYWVKAEHRGKGLGLQIFRRGMDYFKECQIVGLDAVPEQVKNYERSGFRAHCNSIKAVAKKPEFEVEVKSLIVTDRKEIDAKEIGAFDRLHFPHDRTAFLAKAIELGTPIVNRDKETKRVKGYGIVNKMEFGVSLAPLVAESSEAAEEIIQSMFGAVKAGSYVMFYQDEHKEIADVCKKWFPEEMFVCKRMYWKASEEVEDFCRKNVYGLSSLERG